MRPGSDRVSQGSGVRRLEWGSFSQLEPLLMASDGATWDPSARAAAGLLEAPRALVLLEATARLHHVAGQVGFGPELTVTRALSFGSSPLRVVAAQQKTVVLGPSEATSWGLGGWVEVIEGGWTLGAPLEMGGRTVGALVVVGPASAASRPWAREGLTRLAHGVSRQLEELSEELREERDGDVTQVEFGAARPVLLAEVLALQEQAARLQKAADELWEAVRRQSAGGVAEHEPETTRWLGETWSRLEPLRHRLEVARRSEPALFAEAADEIGLLGQAMFELRPALVLARRLALGRVEPCVAREAWRLLGSPERPAPVVEAAARLAHSLCARPPSVGLRLAR